MTKISLFAQLNAFHWAREIEQSDAELATVISTVKETGTSEKDVLAQLEDKYRYQYRSI